MKILLQPNFFKQVNTYNNSRRELYRILIGYFRIAGNHFEEVKSVNIDLTSRKLAKPDKRVLIEPGFYDIGMIMNLLRDLVSFDQKTAKVNVGNSTHPKYIMRPVGSDSNTSNGDLFDMIGGKFPDILCNYKKINIHLNQLKLDWTVSVDEKGHTKEDRLLYLVDVMPVNGNFFGEQVLYKPQRLDILPLSDGIHHKLSFYFTDSCGKEIDMKSEVSLELVVSEAFN